MSKIVSLLLQPLSWVLVLLCIAVILLFTRSRRLQNLGRIGCASAASLLLLVGWYPLPESFVRILEERHAPPSTSLSNFTGMVVLGGVFGTPDGREHQQPALGFAGERVVLPIPLMNQYRNLRMLFTGGSASPSAFVGPEADAARKFFEAMGTDMTRTMFESRSRNTFENAVLSRDVTGVDIRQPWLLFTSASHMPRAFATFQKAGWNVTAYPVDYYSMRETQWLSYSLLRGAEMWQVALREYVGLVAYKLMGRL